MSKLNMVLEVLRGLDGKEVKVFGQNQKITRDDKLCSAVEILESLDSLEVCDSEIYDKYEANDYEYIRGDNTYNWGGHIDYDMNFNLVKIDGEYYCAIMVHMYGDIRGGYTDEILFESDEEMLGILEAIQDGDNYIEFDGFGDIQFLARVSTFRDDIEISYCEDGYWDDTQIACYCVDDIKGCIQEWLSENNKL